MAFGKVWELFLIEEVLMVPNILMEWGFCSETAIHHSSWCKCQELYVCLYYSHVTGPVKFDTGGYHQITLGVDLFCKPVR
jgi:hypothetical protein